MLASQGSFFVGGESKTVTPTPPAGGDPAPRAGLLAAPGEITVNQSHMLMQDRNSSQLADLVLAWIDKHVEAKKPKK